MITRTGGKECPYPLGTIMSRKGCSGRINKEGRFDKKYQDTTRQDRWDQPPLHIYPQSRYPGNCPPFIWSGGMRIRELCLEILMGGYVMDFQMFFF